MSTKAWRVPAGAGIISRSWDDETVIFNPLSGDTHLLDPVAWEGLLCLQEEALECSQLASRLASRLALTLDDQLSHYTRQLIAEFDRLGLIEVIHS